MTDDFESLLDSLVPGAGRRDATDAEAPDFPRELGLEPLEVLARGGSGWVFRARDPVLDRQVAVKIARPEQGLGAQDSLLAEARRTAALDHPSVLPIHRLVVAGGLVCVEYRLAPETTVEALLADPQELLSRSAPARLVLLRGPARALRWAHAQGLVHGDVHPGNLVQGDDGAVYLLDWAGPPTRGATGDPAADGPGGASFSGSPGHAAPEILAGAAHSPASDVFALGVVTWELCAGRPMRPRQRGEDLGTYVARWQHRPTPALPAGQPLPPGVDRLLAQALAGDPGQRPDADSFAAMLDGILSGEDERSHRHARGQALLAQARETLGRYRELGIRLDDEQRVVAIQQGRVPGHAPADAKRALWEAEERLEQLALRRGLMWLEAVEEAVVAGALAAEDHEARDMVAQLWWVRMEDMLARGQEREVALAAHQVTITDPERRGAVLQAPCTLSLDLEARAGQTPPAAVARIQRLVSVHRQLRPEPFTSEPLPLDRLSLPAGRWLVQVEAPGLAPLQLPLKLDRAEHHQAQVRLYSADEIGADWVLVPGGPFLLGGDPLARSALPRCRPTLGDRFMRRTCVTVAEWQLFLRELPAAQARRRAPGGRGPTGEAHPWWTEEQGRWPLPEGWDGRWPIVGVDAEDAAAYAEWISARTRRRQRLPTEEEWEKAARGVDGRSWPWGDRFDPTFAHMCRSRPGAPRLGPVGAFPGDRSPYGCQDMAGGVREWTASWMEHGLVVVRGGAWSDEEHDLRCAARAGRPAAARSATLGFRLVSEEVVAP